MRLEIITSVLHLKGISSLIFILKIVVTFLNLFNKLYRNYYLIK